MGIIYGKLFGTPTIMKDHEEVIFPYNKVKALFYYLLVNKKCSRDELAGLLWPDEEENIAKKNLRNAIYKIKKTFGEEVLISPKKSIVMLNTELEIKTDVDDFIRSKDEWLELYKGEFLQGFFVKNAQGFEEWTIKMREHLKETYRNKLYDKISNSKESSEDVETYAKLLIQSDEFDEKAYRNLMVFYKENRQYEKALKVYDKLSSILIRELGITPDDETKKILNETLENLNLKEESIDTDKTMTFYGRKAEMQSLKRNFQNFLEGRDGKSVIIIGEAGVGKTALKEKFISSIEEDVYIFQTACYKVEKVYLLKTWNSIISKLSDTIESENIVIPTIWNHIISAIFPELYKNGESSNVKLIENIDTLKYEVVGDALVELLKKVTEKKKVIFVFEDIQWMDDMSLSLLSSIILHQYRNNIIFIATCRNEYDENVDRFMTTMKNYNKISTLNVKRFTSEEMEELVRLSIPIYKFTKELLKKIYDETEGNAFFINEYLNAIKSGSDINIMSSKMQDVLKSRFLDISEEGKKILNIASLFFDEINIDILRNITGKDELELMDIIEELEHRFILKDMTDGETITFKFTHQKLREFVYLKQSEGRKKILHNKIAKLLEKTLKNNKGDINIYHKLIYHYTNGGNDIEALNYKIKSLNYYLNFSHELFPIVKGQEIDGCNTAYFSKKQTITSLKDVEKLLKDVKKKEENSEKIKEIEIAFLHMQGRYLIREGDYEEGTRNIQAMIEKALEIGDRDYALEGYKQIIYYCIQTNNTEVMMKYVSLALNLAVECNYHKETGILLRLKGLYKIMCGEYKEAEELLNESISIFNITKEVADKYSLNIAAAYNYIGEIRRFNRQFSQAATYYDKAIAICEDKKALSSLSVFNINAGQAAFEMGDYEKSKDHFEKAYNLYRQYDSIWRRSVVEAFMALLCVKEEKYHESLKYLKSADMHSQKIKNPHEVGMVYRVKAEIRITMEDNENLRKVFSRYLDKDIDHYCEEGIRFLKTSRDNYEIEVINIMRKNYMNL